MATAFDRWAYKKVDEARNAHSDLLWKTWKKQVDRRSPHVDDLSDFERSLLLCLGCRQVGHYQNECEPSETETNARDDIRKEHEAIARMYRFAEAMNETYCIWCSDCVESLESFIEETTTAHSMTGPIHLEASRNGHRFFNLGPSWRLKLFANCPLCRLLFGALPRLSLVSDDIATTSVLIIDSAFHNLGMDCGINPNDSRKAGFAVYGSELLPFSSVRPTHDPHARRPISGFRDPEAMLLRPGPFSFAKVAFESQDSAGLKARAIKSGLDFDLYRAWIDRCSTTHDHAPVKVNHSPGLPLRVIDISQRRVVPFSYQEHAEYVALSYVWGGVAQSFPDTEYLPPLSRTVEDAMVFVANLGKHFLWVDAICINQRDAKELEAQCNVMDDIYNRAWLTLIVLSADRANEGISLLSGNDRPIPQVKAQVGNLAMLATSTTLEDEVKPSAWIKRAW